MSNMSNYNYKDELCKIFTSLPFELINIVCKDANIYTEINSKFKIKFIASSIFTFILFTVLSYYIFFKKNTTILKSNKIVGVILTVCIILSSYYTIMTIIEEGEYGLDGEKGFSGDPGEVGDTGKLGPNGYKGDVGNVGSAGNIGPLGIRGNIGEKGPTGVRGVRGKRGIKGRKGYKGIQGDKGPTGKNGITGDIGPKGTKGKDSRIIFGAAKGGGGNLFGDSNMSYPVYTFDSESQQTKWLEPYPFFHVKGDKKFRNMCDISDEDKNLHINKTFNECKALCNEEKTEDGYLKCVGIYGEIDPEQPNSKRGKCFICPERKETPEYVISNFKKLSGANSTYIGAWSNFVTGIRMKALDDNDSAHAYLSNFYISSKE